MQSYAPLSNAVTLAELHFFFSLSSFEQPICRLHRLYFPSSSVFVTLIYFRLELYKRKAENSFLKAYLLFAFLSEAALYSNKNGEWVEKRGGGLIDLHIYKLR